MSLPPITALWSQRHVTARSSLPSNCRLASQHSSVAGIFDAVIVVICCEIYGRSTQLRRYMAPNFEIACSHAANRQMECGNAPQHDWAQTTGIEMPLRTQHLTLSPVRCPWVYLRLSHRSRLPPCASRYTERHGELARNRLTALSAASRSPPRRYAGAAFLDAVFFLRNSGPRIPDHLPPAGAEWSFRLVISHERPRSYGMCADGSARLHTSAIAHTLAMSSGPL